jgi:hypothetical protein
MMMLPNPQPCARLCRAAVLAALLMCAPGGWSQGCALCNDNAKQAAATGRTALNRGIAVLLVPPVGMMASLIGYAFWRSRRDNEDES